MTRKLKYSLILLLVSLCMLLPHLSILPVNIMEARNFITAREMVQDGNWLLTTMNGLPRYEKPPLPTWITAVLGSWGNFENLWLMRLPVVLITLLLVWSVFKLLARMALPLRQQFFAGLILITSFYIYFAGRDNQWDIYCHSFVMVAIVFLWRLFNRIGNQWENSILAGIFIGCSILSKGPVSLYALLLPFLLAYAIVYGYRIRSGGMRNTGAVILLIVISLGVGVSWPLYVRFMDPHTVEEVARVESGRWASYNTRPFYYYWSFFTQSGIWTVPALISLMYPYMTKVVRNRKAYTFVFAWTILSFILLSIIPEKKTRYLLPVLIPLAINISFYVDYLFSAFKNELKKGERRVAVMGFGIAGVVGVAFPFVQFFMLREEVSQTLVYSILTAVFLFILGWCILWGLYKREFNITFYSTVLLQCAVVIFAFGMAGAFTYNPSYRSAKELRQIEDKEQVIFVEYSGFTPEIIWDYGKKIPRVSLDSLNATPHKTGLLVVPEEEELVNKQLGKVYKMQKVMNVDLNYVAPDKKKHNSRLVRAAYLIIPKS